MKRTRPIRRWAISLALLGGATGVAGTISPWFHSPEGVTVGTTAIKDAPPVLESHYGLIALIAAGAPFMLGLFALSNRMRFTLGVLMIAAAAVAASYAVLALHDPKASYIDFAARKASSPRLSGAQV